jgi:hypothetical protein
MPRGEEYRGLMAQRDRTMFFVRNVLISKDFRTARFSCDFDKCEGLCCIEGDRGAPLTSGEARILRSEISEILPYLDEEARYIVGRVGGVLLDNREEYTMLYPGEGPCVFLIQEEGKEKGCILEQLWQDGKITSRKPVSCHLFPVIEKTNGPHTVLSLERRYTCDGCWDHKQSPLAVHYCKEALERRFGEQFVEELLETVLSES